MNVIPFWLSESLFLFLFFFLGGEVEAKVMIVGDYSDFFRNLDSGPSKKFVAWFVLEVC